MTPRRRASVLEPLGFAVTYFTRPKFRGGDSGEICFAWRDGRTYYPTIDPGHFARLEAAQDQIPYMVPMALRVDDCTVFEQARGRLLWDCNPAPPSATIAAQLQEFGKATRQLGLMHADLRPWNIFWDETRGEIEIIDWGHGGFVDELRVGSFTLGHLKATQHHDRPLSELAGVDLEDARRLERLLRGEIGLQAAWNCSNLTWRPVWCLE